jgi:hypothetical protein
MPLVDVLQQAMQAGSTLIFGALALLIVLKAGDKPANVAMALAIAFVFSVDTIYRVLFPFCSDSLSLQHALRTSLFVLGAGFYLRASQMFPRPLVRADISSSPTVWGRVAVARNILALLLPGWITWVFVVSVGVLAFVAPFAMSVPLARIALILIGVAYFHISFRSGDPEVRRKVLWFLLAVLAVALLSTIALGIRTTIGPSMGYEMKATVSLVLSITNTLVLMMCFSAAVFYAGAISPEFVLRKTFVYGATVAVFLFAFSLLQELVVDSLVGNLGVADGLVSAIFATLFGLAFYPVTRRIERLFKHHDVADHATPQTSASAGPTRE